MGDEILILSVRTAVPLFRSKYYCFHGFLSSASDEQSLDRRGSFSPEDLGSHAGRTSRSKCVGTQSYVRVSAENGCASSRSDGKETPSAERDEIFFLLPPRSRSIARFPANGLSANTTANRTKETAACTSLRTRVHNNTILFYNTIVILRCACSTPVCVVDESKSYLVEHRPSQSIMRT